MYESYIVRTPRRNIFAAGTLLNAIMVALLILCTTLLVADDYINIADDHLYNMLVVQNCVCSVCAAQIYTERALAICMCRT